MNMLKKSILASMGVALLALTLALTNVAHAVAEAVKDVVVVNPTSQPVPIKGTVGLDPAANTVRAQQSGTWSVGITNSSLPVTLPPLPPGSNVIGSVGLDPTKNGVASADVTSQLFDGDGSSSATSPIATGGGAAVSAYKEVRVIAKAKCLPVGCAVTIRVFSVSSSTTSPRQWIIDTASGSGSAFLTNVYQAPGTFVFVDALSDKCNGQPAGCVQISSTGFGRRN